MRPRPFEALERDRQHMVKTLADLRAGHLDGVAASEVAQLILDIEKRIDAINRQLDDDTR